MKCSAVCLEEPSYVSSCNTSDPVCPRRRVGFGREEQGRCGADVVAVCHLTEKAPLLWCSSRLKSEVCGKLLEVPVLVAAGHLLGLRVLDAPLGVTFLLVLCWSGQTRLRLVLLPCSVLLWLLQTDWSVLFLSKPYLLLHVASGEVAVWLVSHRILDSSQVHVKFASVYPLEVSTSECTFELLGELGGGCDAELLAGKLWNH